MQNHTLEKVIRMALALQGEPREQGYLAQALLELGDDGNTILLAKEAQLRQTADGRAAIIDRAEAPTHGRARRWAAPPISQAECQRQVDSV